VQPAHGTLTKSSDLQHINTQINQAKRYGYCSPDLPSFEELHATAVKQLFCKIVLLPSHVLYPLLTPPSSASQNYRLRQCTQTLQLPTQTMNLSETSLYVCCIKSLINPGTLYHNFNDPLLYYSIILVYSPFACVGLHFDTPIIE